MANIVDYLEWRSDITFDQVEFNVIDSLILCLNEYNSFNDLVDSQLCKKGVSLNQIYKDYYTKGNVPSRLHVNPMVNSQMMSLIEKTGRSKRYGQITATGYRNIIDLEKDEQFSAITYSWGKGFKRINYIVFRGTDDNIVGWKEDFNLTFKEVPAQKDALAYLEEVAARLPGKIIIGGHSKGGNLEIYAAARCSDKTRKRIGAIYNFDGPGFDEEFIQSENFKKIKPIIHTFYPQESIVGMMMFHDDDYTIVESEKHLVDQHDPFNWHVNRSTFIERPDLNEGSKFVNETMNQWIYDLSPEQRELFVDALFSITDELGARKNEDLTENGFKSFFGAVKSVAKLDSKTRKAVFSTIRLLMKFAKENVSMLKNHH